MELDDFSFPYPMRLAIIFAADVNPESAMSIDVDEPTRLFSELAARIGLEADRLRQSAEVAGKDFYACAYVEAAAQAANQYGLGDELHFERLCAAGQAESDAIAKGPDNG